MPVDEGVIIESERHNMKRNLSIVLILFIVSMICRSGLGVEKGRFKDTRDNRVYRTVTIGKQEWFAENFAYMPHVYPMGCGDGIWVGRYYKNDTNEARKTKYYKTYGCLYSEKKAKTLCPPGWRLPTMADWEALIASLGGEEEAGNRLKAPGIEKWSVPLKNPKDRSGFAALPGGDILIDDGYFLRYVGKAANFWTANEEGLVETVYFILFDGLICDQDAFEDMFGCSIRYVRDVPESEGRESPKQ
jgi:uncharacterized protein (TIGR02145 family)